MSSTTGRLPKIPNAFASDVALNTLSFGLVIGTQQLLIMPILARATDATGFSHQILLWTVSTIIVNVLGVELANTKLARAAVYRRSNWSWDLSVVLVIAAILGGLLAIAAPVLFGLQGSYVWAFAAITVIGIFRSYVTAALRLDRRFKAVVGGSCAYVLGSVLGLVAVHLTGWLAAPFIFGELMATCLLVLVRPFRHFRHQIRRTPGFSQSVWLFIQLACVALLVNSVAYFDRLLAFPLLGAAALAIYYSASVVSKSLGLLTNPISSVLLAQLARSSDSEASLVGRRILRYSPIVFVVSAALNIVISYIAVGILYPGFFDEASTLIVPIGIAAAFGSASDFLKTVIVRQNMGLAYLSSNAIYAFAFGTAVFFLTAGYGLMGFALAAVVGRAVQFGLFVFLVWRHSRRGDTPRAHGIREIEVTSGGRPDGDE